METRIHNIPCFFDSAGFLEGIDKTLRQIREKCPKDYLRLQGLVREIRPYGGDDERIGGEWVEDSPIAGDVATWGYGFGDTPGVVKLDEDMPFENLPSTLAHELGHAATRQEDLYRRGPISDEWKSELSANWYAYKWGFGRQIARLWKKSWDLLHHGPPPGSTFEEEFNGKVHKYRISRNFVAREI